MADVDSRIKEVRQQWQDAITSIRARKEGWRCDVCGQDFGSSKQLRKHILANHGDQFSDDELQALRERESKVLGEMRVDAPSGAFADKGSRSRRSGDVSISEALDFGDISRMRLAAYMALTFLFLILVVTIGFASLWMAPFTGIIGIWLLFRADENSPMSMLFGILFLLHPSLLLLTVIGLDVTVMSALLGIAGFVLAGVEQSTKDAMGKAGDVLFQSLSAIIVPLWILSLANVVLSIFAGQFLNLGFAAMVVASIGTSVYLFAGNIQDAFGVYSGIGHGVGTVYEHLVVGHEVRGARGQLYIATFGSVALFYYALLLFRGVNVPVLGFLLQNPAVPFLAGMLGPIAFWHLLSRAEHIAQAGVAYGQEVASQAQQGYQQGQRPRGPDEGPSRAERFGRWSNRSARKEIKNWQNRVDQLDSDIRYAQNLQDRADDERLSVRSQRRKIRSARDTLNNARSDPSSVSDSDMEMAEREISNAIGELEDAFDRAEGGS